MKKSTGEPVANAQVFLSKGGVTMSGRTNDQGVLETDVVEQGTYRYSIRKSGFFDASGEVVIDGIVSPEIAIEQGQVTVEFRVVDPHFDPPRPVKDARVRVGSLATVNTSGSGTFSIGVPVNSAYRVTVEKGGYESASRRLIVEESPKRVVFNISRTPRLNLTAANSKIVVGQTVRVTVVDEYGNAVEGATLLVNGTAAAETNAQGVAKVPIETAGDHELVARTKGLESSPVIVEGVEEATPTTTPTTTTTTTTPTTTSRFGPGFGPTSLLAALALLATALLALRRR